MSKEQEILALRAEGKTYRQIKEKLDCSIGTISYFCNPIQKEKTLSRQRDRRSKNRKWLQERKNNQACVDCGERYPYFILQYDHTADDKIDNVSLMLNRSREEILLEIAKCELVCANCHAFRTHSRLVSHGADVLELYMESQTTGE